MVFVGLHASLVIMLAQIRLFQIYKSFGGGDGAPGMKSRPRNCDETSKCCSPIVNHSGTGLGNEKLTRAFCGDITRNECLQQHYTYCFYCENIPYNSHFILDTNVLCFFQ